MVIFIKIMMILVFKLDTDYEDQTEPRHDDHNENCNDLDNHISKLMIMINWNELWLTMKNKRKMFNHDELIKLKLNK